jgi:CheY-like chemotaxis protein
MGADEPNAETRRATSVLIVEDDAECRTCLEGIFQEEGCLVFTANDGRHALEVLKHVRPDLLVVDLVMPVMNGWDLCAELEHRPELADIPVVILSAVARFRPAGRKRVLSKPVRLETVVALLDFVDAP